MRNCNYDSTLLFMLPPINYVIGYFYFQINLAEKFLFYTKIV